MSEPQDLPDRTKCKIAKIAKLDDSYELCQCLTSDPQFCKYATSFGYSYFCQHTDRMTFHTEERKHTPK